VDEAILNLYSIKTKSLNSSSMSSMSMSNYYEVRTTMKNENKHKTPLTELWAYGLLKVGEKK